MKNGINNKKVQFQDLQEGETFSDGGDYLMKKRRKQGDELRNNWAINDYRRFIDNVCGLVEGKNISNRLGKS